MQYANKKAMPGTKETLPSTLGKHPRNTHAKIILPSTHAGLSCIKERLPGIKETLPHFQEIAPETENTFPVTQAMLPGSILHQPMKSCQAHSEWFLSTRKLPHASPGSNSHQNPKSWFLLCPCLKAALHFRLYGRYFWLIQWVASKAF